MKGDIYAKMLIRVALVFWALSATECRADKDLLSVTLPKWSATTEYVAECFSNKHVNLTCDWARRQKMAPEDVVLNVLVSHPLQFYGEACLEFWYLAPAASNGSELNVMLKTSTSLAKIWTSPALPRKAWRQVTVPLNISEPGSQIVFEAVQPVSVDQKTLKQIGVKTGSCGNQCNSNTELWTDDSTRCLCSAGQLYCFPSQCPQNQHCGPQRKKFGVTSTSGICTIHGHSQYTTFDGVVFRFLSPCTYVLAKTCSPTEVLPRFNVKVVNVQNNNASLPTVQQITVDLKDIKVSLLRSQAHWVVVNGVSRQLPLIYGNGAIQIKGNPAAVVLATSFGLSVSLDRAGNVHITVPFDYSDKICGLCGNFNFLRGDDFRKSDGTNAENPSAFAESWQTKEEASCETILEPQQCDLLEEAIYGSELYCGLLYSGTGPFADCLLALGAESYFRACVFGMCSAHGDQMILCQALQSYADLCQEAGATVSLWRNSTFCSLECSENSHYNSCAVGCPEVCTNLDLTSSCGSCVEKCECNSGFKLSGGRCVPADHCGCWYNGKHYEKGEILVEGNCVQQCQCMGNNAMQCTAMHCRNYEVCKEKDGIKGCFAFKPATCNVYGDPHYVTFDKSAYEFQGGCSYMLATTCGGQSLVRFTVIGLNMHPDTQNFTRSKLEAVSLQVDNLYLTLNQSGEVHVHEGYVTLPYSTTGTYGSVLVYKTNSIILEATFGLKIIMDGHSRLFLQVDECYKYELCGLCGTYSDYQYDDFIMPGGQIADESFEFADSWRENSVECVAQPNNPKHCVGEELHEANDDCSILFLSAFEACHEYIHPSIYFGSCVYDYCDTSGDRIILCESLKSYAAACQIEGVELSNWWIGTACEDSLTTTAPTTKLPTTPYQPLCPLTCNFDTNICGWEQLVQDTFDWTRHSGPTPSNLTGPNYDHTTGAGFYLYLEGDGVSHGDSARMLSSVCHYVGPLCLHFWYYMYGSARSMALNIYILQNHTATKLWSMRNDQGPEWHRGNVDLNISNPFQIILEGIRGSTSQSDVALDDVAISFGSCSDLANEAGTALPFTTTVIPHQICNLDCSFDGNLCTWNQMITDSFDWMINNGSTPTQMTGPFSGGGGSYLYIEASKVTYGDTARLISSECSDTGPQCLQFWYHMYGSADTMRLQIYLLQNNLASSVWQRENDQGNAWHLAQVDFNATQLFKIIIEGCRGSNNQSDVAVDEIKLQPGHCSGVNEMSTTAAPRPPVVNETSTTAAPRPPVVNETSTTAAPRPPVVNETSTTAAPRPPVVNETTTAPGQTLHPVCQFDCDFEQDLCLWSQLLTDVFDWERHSGSTPTNATGPSSDHTTGGGHYLYIKANKATHGDTARLISPVCLDPGSQCLQFWYHMYGSADTMGINVYLLQDQNVDAVWQKRNDQGNVWHLAQVDLVTAGEFQIIIEGRRGSNYESDVAIDDISLEQGICEDLVKLPQPPTTTGRPANETVPQPPTTTGRPANETVPQPPTTTGRPANETVPQPPTTTGRPANETVPQPPTTTGRPANETVPQPPTTTGRPANETVPQPPTTTGRPANETVPQPPTTTGRPANETVPQPPTTTGRPANETVPQPPTTTGRPANETVPQPPTTTGRPANETVPQPPTTTGRPANETVPQPPTTTGRPANETVPQPPTTTGRPANETVPQPPTTTGRPANETVPQPPTTTGRPANETVPQPPTTTGRPANETVPQPPTTTGRPANETVPQPPTTTGRPANETVPQPPTTTGRPANETVPQPPTTTGRPANETVPQPPTTTGRPANETVPQPPTTTGRPANETVPQPPTTTGRPANETVPQPPTTTGRPANETVPQPPTTTGRPANETVPQPPTTTGRPANETVPQPPTTTGRPANETVPQPPTTTGRPANETLQPVTHVQTPSCAENSHYTTCIPACSPTCRHLDGPPQCSIKNCVAGCVCDDGFVQKRRVCVPLQECGCVTNGTVYRFNEVWYTSHCIQKCECDEDDGKGKLDCHDEECGDDVCLQNMMGQYYCTSTGFTECTIKGDPEYKTFDKMKHDFEGKHFYVLVRTKTLPSNLPEIYIEGTNTCKDDGENDNSSEEEGSSQEGDVDDGSKEDAPKRSQELKIKVYNITVELKQKSKVFVNGQEVKTPVSPLPGLKIKEQSSHISLKTDFGLTVEFSKRCKTVIILPNFYKRRVEGLCGNFDGRKGNDQIKSDGTMAQNTQEFGESWRVVG
ncbi:zonadhesin isoform X1 [Kryptolebias marmoratus]|uniref:zonadhesin isoform X1 n=1 Tax=Kryptolebias marmoratus TaxID=37003 RepID=UPI0007F8706A|nr:zonadhesin isoform X1 [Kryptolebias marmoratus]